MIERDERPGLYVHVPFCLTRCRYCDFFSTTELDQRERWLGALLQELVLEPEEAWEPFGSLYLGGGTPSMLDDVAIERLLMACEPRLAELDVELTIEANPDDLDRRRMRRWRELGWNRLSLGLQSLDNEELRLLGRRHDADQAIRILGDLRASGFENFSIDLIYGLPGQTLERWSSTLARALESEPPHLSCYQLTYEPATPLGRAMRRGEVDPLDEEQERQFFFATHELLTSAGYEHYEISSYARPAMRSAHNQRYWRSVPYLGLGPSAHSFDGERRWWNASDLEDYFRALLGASAVRRGAARGEELLSAEQRRVERIMLGFRTTEGVAQELLSSTPQDTVNLDALIAEGLVVVEADRVRPTLAGFLVADSLPLRFE